MHAYANRVQWRAGGVTIMRTLIWISVALILALGAVAQNVNDTKSGDEQALRRLELQMARGEQENDWSKIGGVVADDWVGVARQIVSKPDMEQGTKHAAEEHGSNPYTVEKKNMRVDLFGDTAVVSYTKEYRQTADTSKVAHEEYTDVFTRTAGVWELHYTRISPTWPPLASQ